MEDCEEIEENVAKMWELPAHMINKLNPFRWL